MTRIIQIGRRGELVVYLEGSTIRVQNNTTCPLLVDGKLLQPGQVS